MSDVTTPSAADRSFDLSLRLLTALVLAALAGSVSFLAYRWLAPRLSQTDSAAATMKIAPRPAAPVASEAGSTRGDQVLMDPGRVFRCEEQGRVSFSDQACANGAPPGAGSGPAHTKPAPAAH